MAVNPERYFENPNRLRAHATDIDNGRVFTLEQVRDICELIKAKKLPDGHYGDDECHLWSVIYNTLELHSK